jgi:hypothetical protein
MNMDFNLLPPGLDARLNSALSCATGRIKRAVIVAEQVRTDARERASRCRDERLGSEILQDYLAEAEHHVQEEREQAACELFSKLIGIRLAAGDDPAEVARELKRGLPGSVREQMEAIVPLTPSTLRVLGVALDQQCEKCWEQAELNEPVPGPAKRPGRGRGIPPDAVDHARVVAACQKFGDNWRSRPVEICHELARLNSKFPKAIDERFSSWQELADALEGDRNKPTRRKLVQYLRYRLKWQRAQVSLP